MEFDNFGRRAPALLALIASLLAACSSGGDGRTPGATSGTAPEFYAAWKKKYCAALTPCCRAGGVYHDPSTCETWYSGSDVRAAEQLGIPFDSAMASQCLAELDTWYSTCSKSGDGPDSCQKIFRGTVPPGGACKNRWECAPPRIGPRSERS